MQIIESLTKLLDYIYKKKCYFCNSSRECVKMCSKCYDELVFSSLLPNRIINRVEIYSSGIYEKNLQKMIRGVKYHRQKELAYYQAKFMWSYFKELLETKPYLTKEYQLVPVPLFKTREKKRGYNHMKLVAEEFCNLSGYELNTELIKRIKSTKAQYKLSRAQRMENLKNAFEVNKSALIKNKTVLIIDDICTTGSTFESMIEELKQNGITDIVCLATSSPS